MGGAWECSNRLRADESAPRDSSNIVSTAAATGEYEMPCRDEGCTKGACIAGMVLQQS